MVRTLITLTVLTSLNITTCNFENNEEEHSAPATTAYDRSSEDEQVTEEDEPEMVLKVDSVNTRLDSMMKVKIELPPVYYHNVMEASNEATEKFTALSKTSKGKMKIVVDADIIADEISKTINSISATNSDLLILIDKTYSMSDDIEKTLEGLSQIMDTIKKYRGTRLAIATFGDKNSDGPNWFTFRNFETHYDSAANFISSIEVTGGGDLPESVYDAIIKCKEQKFFRSLRKRNIVLIGDAPPLEKPLSDYSIEDITALSKDEKIKMNFYPIVLVPKTYDEIKLSPAEMATYKPQRLAVTLYPSPSFGRINVSMIEYGAYHMEVYDGAGKQIAGEDFNGLYWTKNLHEYPNGVYVLRIIRDDHQFETMKFILQK